MSRIFGPVRQMGFVVYDIEKAMEHWTRTLGIGPFFYFSSVAMIDFVYRGEAQEIELSIALANDGDVQIELIQQRNDVPSNYRDKLREFGEVLHHTSAWTLDFDADLARIAAQGHAPVQTGRIGKNRLAYFETQGAYPSTTMELYDVSGGAGKLNDKVRAAAVNWDGSDPIRRLN